MNRRTVSHALIGLTFGVITTVASVRNELPADESRREPASDEFLLPVRQYDDSDLIQVEAESAYPSVDPVMPHHPIVPAPTGFSGGGFPRAAEQSIPAPQGQVGHAVRKLQADRRDFANSLESFGDSHSPPHAVELLNPKFLQSIDNEIQATRELRFERLRQLNARLDALQRRLNQVQVAPPVANPDLKPETPQGAMPRSAPGWYPVLPRRSSPSGPQDDMQHLPRLEYRLVPPKVDQSEADSEVPEPPDQVTPDPVLPVPPTSETPDTDDGASNRDSEEADGPVEIPVEIATESEVDRLHLANSLFGSGEFGIALKTYQELFLSNHKSVDRDWVRYQIAACFRRLGNYEAAEKHLRILASRPEAQLPQLARWWLDNIQQRRDIEARVNAARKAIQQLREEGYDDSV